MNKLLLIASAALLMASCGQKADKEEETSKKPATAIPTELKIAYVQTDTLMNQYQFYKDYEKVLTEEGNNIQKELASKQRTIEQHAAAVQQKYENNGFTTRDELERAQAGVQREQQEFQNFAARLQNDFQEHQNKVNKEAMDSIQSFLKSYNKTKKYSYILTKGGMVDNILYADSAFDITNEVVKGLNARYKANPEIAAKVKKAAK